MKLQIIYKQMGSLNFNLSDSEFLDALDAKLDELTDQIFADSQNNIVQKNIIDEGTLLKSGTIKRDYLNKEIKYEVSYADAIEFGRTPGTMPPVNPLIAWVKRKGIAKNDTQAKQIAWAIAQDIKTNGQQPRPYIGPAVEKAKASLK